MAIQKVPGNTNFVHLEHEVLEYWTKTDAFNKLRAQVAGGKPWSFLDGPITANNPMGVHHAWGRTYKDVFQRYFAMNGRDQRFQNGFDCQGLWVEIEVEKALGYSTKDEIEAYGIDKFVEACKARVDKYAKVQTEQSIRLGYWMDWDTDDDFKKRPDERRSYYTLAEVNNYTIWHFLKKCHERGYIYRGTDVMPWSGRAGSAYSDMEVKEGRRLTTHTSVFVRFPIREREGEYLLIWTTTPWTLPGNVGAAVNGDLDYVKVRAKKDGAVYYLAKENLEFQRLAKEHKEGFGKDAPWPKGLPKLKTIAQIFKEQGGYEELGVVKGRELVNLTYDGPFDELPAQQKKGGHVKPASLIPESQRDWPASKDAHRVIDPGRDSKGEPYVVAGEGTGIVHTAPGSGDVDHRWGERFELVSIAPLDEEGKYIDGFGPFSGMRASDPETTKALLESLKEKGYLVASEEYPHIYPHCWRTGDELVYRLVDEWYISMDWRDEIIEVAKQVNWLPDDMHGLERELDWLKQMRDWMISKKRFWGLALPIWECKKCGWFDVIGSRDELKKRAIKGWDEFEGNTPHRPWVDKVVLKCGNCGANAHRIPDVGNPWLDAGIVAFSTVMYETDKAYWKKWIPADLVTECFPGQFRNWFYAMLAMSTMMANIPPFKNLLGHALVLDENGNVMHKSDGTAIWFEEAAEQVGVDTMRWMYCAQHPTSELRFGLRHPAQKVQVEGADGRTIDRTVDGVELCKVTSTPADEVRNRVILTLWNSYRFFADLAAVDGYDPGAKGKTVAGKRPLMDRWILSELQLLVQHVRERVEAFDLANATRRAEQFLDNLSNWYIRRSRRRFYAGEGASKDDLRDKRAAFDTLYEVLTTLARVLAPFVPFITERVHQNLVCNVDESAPISVHLEPFPTANAKLIDAKLSDNVNTVIRLVSLGRNARTQVKIGVRQPLSTLTIMPRDKAEAEAATAFKREFLEELNVKDLVVLAPGDMAEIKTTVKPNFKALGPKVGDRIKFVGQAIAKVDHEALAKELRAKGSIQLELADSPGKPTDFTLGDFILETKAPDHLSLAGDARSMVALDTRIDDALKLEGLVREFIRNIATLRKDTGLQIEDRIVLRYATDDAELSSALSEHADTLKEEVLATELHTDLANGTAAAPTHDLDLKGHAVKVQLAKM